MEQAIEQLKIDLRDILARYGMHMHAVEVYPHARRGGLQVALMATDRAENLTGLGGTGFKPPFISP